MKWESYEIIKKSQIIAEIIQIGAWFNLEINFEFSDALKLEYLDDYEKLCALSFETEPSYIPSLLGYGI